MEARQRAFQQLKPICVKLSEVALKSMGANAKPPTKDLVDHLQQLLRILRAISSQPNALDKKLADYVFFPLSSVLKQLEKVSLQVKQLTFETILVLLQTAWSKDVSPDLGMQLLILYTFVLDQDTTRKSEELSTVLFRSVAQVTRALGKNLVSTQSVPHLGKGISLILEDGVLKGKAEDVQLAAVDALDAFVRTMTDKDALGTSFLPGIMSCLAKSMSGQGTKVTAKVVAMQLNVLTYLLPTLFADTSVKVLPEDGAGLSKKWLKATAPQVKMALANILKLQAHDRSIVRMALGRLCAGLLQDCPDSMEDSVSMLLEASLTLATKEESLEAELKHLLMTSSSFAGTLQESLHYWIMSLPRLMDSADETKKQRRIQQITLSFRLLNQQGLDMGMINRDLASNLRDSVVGAIKNPNKNGDAVAVFETMPNMSLEVVKSAHVQVREFEQIIAMQRSQVETIKDLSGLARAITSSDASLRVAQDLIGSIYNFEGDLQLSSFWLILNMVRFALITEKDTDAFLSFSDAMPDVKQDLLEQLYDFSISTLSNTSLASTTDWRLQALALEAVALQASQQKEDFRTELIDALYPILHYMGSSHPSLRQHALVTLDIVAHACNYSTASDHIISNVDYLVNAVALRLNTYDISPQAPQVLLMMVRLAGPRLLPYLDDTVDSIFAALEMFHGYPKLVDLLFRVLKVIVEEGAKAEQLSIEDSTGSPIPERKKTSIEDVVATIKHVTKKYEEAKIETIARTHVPQEPWGPGSKEEPADGDITNDEPKEPEPPAPRTYSLLLNISKLTQHYLTSSSPELRVSLLDLLSSSFPALAKHENSFLPLIHTLWPVLVPRLDDQEPYVVAASMEVIGLMCRYGGDFMSGRVGEVWGKVMRVFRTRTGKAGKKPERGISKPANIADIVTIGRNDRIVEPNPQPYYVDAPSRIIWERLVEMLINISTYTSTSDAIFDDIVEILTPVLAAREDVRQALEFRNADAVWLALFRHEMKHDPESTLDNAKSMMPLPILPEALRNGSDWAWAVLR